MATYPPPIIIRTEFASPYATIRITTSTPQTPPPSKTGQPSPTVLFIHGNSSSSQIFRDFFFPPKSSTAGTSTSPPPLPLSQTHRLVAFDLPGHGASSNLAPHLRYSVPLYAQVTHQLINYLQLDSVIVLGWSLGGHVGIELMPLLGAPRLKGLMLVGTPPVPHAQPELGFHAAAHMATAEAETLTDDEADAFARAACGEPCGGKREPFHLSDVLRTEGRARREMFEALRAGEGRDQLAVVQGEKDMLVGVVNGSNEPFVKLDFLDEVKWGRLWGRKCVRLEGLGHVPFWERWEVFEGCFKEFVWACES